MTNTKMTAVEKAVEEQKQNAEKLVLKWIAIRKTLTRRDNLEAVAALGDIEDWGDLEILIAMARKATGKSWEELENMTQGDLEGIVLT